MIRAALHRWRRFGWPGRLQLLVAAVLQLAILGVLLGAVIEGRWRVTFIAAAVFALTFLPAIIERELSVILPVEFTLINCAFLYAAFVLGEMQQFYERIWWWDLMLHSISALVMGLLGFVIVFSLYMTDRVRMAPLLVAITSFGFAVSMGTLWEIFEFLMDHFFGTNMLKSGLHDTFTDLMVNAAGALVAAISGYFYVRGQPTFLIDSIVQRFVAGNPHLFSRHPGRVRQR